MEKHEERGEGEQSLLQAAVKCLLFASMDGAIARIEWQLIHLEEAPSPLGLLSSSSKLMKARR